MDFSHITFGIKDVIAIISFVASAVTVYYKMKAADKDNKSEISNLKDDLKAEHKYIESLKKEVDEKLLHAKNAKKANIQMIYQDFNKLEKSIQDKETQIYDRMKEIKEEQKEAHEKLSNKIDEVVKMQQTMNTSLAELTGFLKGKQNNEKK